MTIYKAIIQLEDLRKDRESFAKLAEPSGVFEQDIEAIDIAVKALKIILEAEAKEISIDEQRALTKHYDVLPENYKQALYDSFTGGKG